MSVSAGSSSSDDIALAAMGGTSFSDRLTELLNARQSAVAAYEALQIGTDARTEYDKATALNAQAEKALADAKVAAAGLVQEAQDKASAVINEANAAALQLRNEASQMRSDAAALRQDIDTQLASAQATAQKQSDDAVKAAAQTQTLWAEIAAKKADLDARMLTAGAAEARWTMAVASLKSLIDKA